MVKEAEKAFFKKIDLSMNEIDKIKIIKELNNKTVIIKDRKIKYYIKGQLLYYQDDSAAYYLQIQIKNKNFQKLRNRKTEEQRYNIYDLEDLLVEENSISMN